MSEQPPKRVESCPGCGSPVDPVSGRSLYHFDVDVPMGELREELERVKAERDQAIALGKRGVRNTFEGVALASEADDEVERLRSELGHLQKVAADRRYSDEFVGNLARSTLADLSPKDRG